MSWPAHPATRHPRHAEMGTAHSPSFARGGRRS